MKKSICYSTLVPVYLVILAGFMFLTIAGSKAITVFNRDAPITNRRTIVIDAGHGGVDGGATSCTGVLESQFNLEIALKLNDLMHLLGMNTLMIRTTDCSVYTKGNSIAQKKVSDLKERVRVVNNTDNAVLLSIHQNHFSDKKYNGAQVFYAKTEGSQDFAGKLQKTFVEMLNPGSRRQIKKADSVYLMQHINCPAVLIECGFLSNPNEERLLRDNHYQQKICCIIACTLSEYLFGS